jgi:hypothetical protein
VMTAWTPGASRPRRCRRTGRGRAGERSRGACPEHPWKPDVAGVRGGPGRLGGRVSSGRSGRRPRRGPRSPRLREPRALRVRDARTASRS